MKNIKSVLALVLVVCLTMGLAVTAFATAVNPSDTDVSSGVVENETPKTEENETPKAEENETPKAEENETPKAEENETPKAEENETPKTEENGTAPTEGESKPTETVTTGAGEEKKEVAPVWKTVRTVVTVLEVIASLILVIVVLMQSGKEAGLSSAISGNSDSYASKNGSLDKKLAKATKWVAVAWLVLTLILCLLPKM